MAPESHNPKNTPFLAAHYGTQKAIVKRNKNYQESVGLIKKAFKTLRSTHSDRIAISAWFEEFQDTLQIPEELWPELMSRLMSVKVVLINPSELTDDEPIDVFVKSGPGPPLKIRAYPGDSIFSIKRSIEDNEGTDTCDQTLYLGSTQLVDNRSLFDCGIKDGSALNLVTRNDPPARPVQSLSAFEALMNMPVKKPVIYLFPPTSTSNIRVRLSLVSAWTFSTLYPPTKVTSETTLGPDVGETVTWVVDAKPDGMLFDQGTSREVTYLFWEAHAERKLLSPAPSRPGSPGIVTSAATFNPSNPILKPHDAALVAFDKVTAYLDDALLHLGLHTEARTSFITYWLPDLSKYKLIALRFVPQDEFEKAAPLAISPAPDVVTRVFMLFRGVDENELGTWASAQDIAQKGPRIWRSVVGVDVDKSSDSNLFRVLEWGGMEVK